MSYFSMELIWHLDHSTILIRIWWINNEWINKWIKINAPLCEDKKKNFWQIVFFKNLLKFGVICYAEISNWNIFLLIPICSISWIVSVKNFFCCCCFYCKFIQERENRNQPQRIRVYFLTLPFFSYENLDFT